MGMPIWKLEKIIKQLEKVSEPDISAIPKRVSYLLVTGAVRNGKKKNLG